MSIDQLLLLQFIKFRRTKHIAFSEQELSDLESRRLIQERFNELAEEWHALTDTPEKIRADYSEWIKRH